MKLVDKKRFFRPDEVAQILGLSRRTVYRMIQDGRFADVQTAQRPCRIPRAAIIALLPELINFP
jgi:excisionase family DNA binding protein